MFVAEAATLAHVARPLALLASLTADEFETAFACDPRCKWLLRDFADRHLPLSSMGSAHFLAALARGKPLYDEPTLDRYVYDDLQLLDKFRPSVVVGDFRLSLSISARLRGVPYVAISNCYWSPYWRPPRYTVPSIRPLTEILPIPIANTVFQVGRPIAFALHCRPLNRVRRKHGLPSLGQDLRRVYTDADYVLYADIPELFPDASLPANHKFIGPLTWSPPAPCPNWWNEIPNDRPVVYVTMGSSGRGELLQKILDSLATFDITVIAATAGNKLPDDIPSNTYVTDYLAGEEAARRSRLVVCNGGSPTSHQALSAGVPVIGIASNLDQFLNMDTLVRAGAGEVMRADRFSEPILARLVSRIFERREYAAAAVRIAASIASDDYVSRFATIIRSVLKA